MSRLDIEQCYTATLDSLHSVSKHGEHDCVQILPYPKEYELPHLSPEPNEIPTVFRMSNYEDKLKNARCSAVFSQYNTLALNEARESGRVIKPKFMVAPMKTSITFFDKSHATPFSITPQEFNDMQDHASKLPSYFNWMEENDHITKPFNQGLCGSCWAVATATCLSDVFVVSKKSATNPNLSPTYILSCLPQSQCDGGDPSKAVFDVSQNGIGTMECLDYSWCMNSACSGDPLKHFGSKSINQYIPQCKCATATVKANSTKYFVHDAFSICIPPKLEKFSNLEQSEIKYYLDNMYGNVDSTTLDLSKQSNQSIQDLIKYHIYTYGPVIGGFHVFKNFFKGDYHETNGIYVETASYSGVQGVNYSDLERDWVGSHAVVIVGWGVDTVKGESVRYWVVRNSWGSSWGNRGMFKMAMYGDDPKKKYQNRASQFEYPSIMTSDMGIGITGGIIIMKAGAIHPDTSQSGPQPEPSQEPEPTPSPSQEPEPEPSQEPEPEPTPSPSQEPEPEPSQEPILNDNKPRKAKNMSYSIIAFSLFIAFFIALYYIFRQSDKDQWLVVAETVLLIVLFSTILKLLPMN